MHCQLAEVDNIKQKSKKLWGDQSFLQVCIVCIQ